ncbi:MAG: 3-deoxy-7-phosphoheptulonate synthase [Syntrophomonadaceae bacterium]|nr:3-deoxy-7-phosphoheptulonate synthase [Syntrophomonadaceae bacterium]
MVVVMKKGAAPEQINAVKQRLLGAGFNVHLSEGVNRTILGAVGDRQRLEACSLEAMPGVDTVVAIMKPFKMASREFKADNTVIQVGQAKFGDGSVPVIAGPCAVEGREQYIETAAAVRERGAELLRGGAFKPRTSPYSFQGLGEEGLKIMAEAREITGLPIVTEVMDQKSVAMVAEYVDIIQIGARNMQNFYLLKEVGKTNKPVLLKRGLSATIEEWLMAAEYILDSGNNQVILCERGIRTFETYTRNTLDLSAVPLVKKLSHLPVIVDPSHGTGKRELIAPMSLAAVACGCDGLIIEVHTNPAEAWSDGPQSLTPDDFGMLMEQAKQVTRAVHSAKTEGLAVCKG